VLTPALRACYFLCVPATPSLTIARATALASVLAWLGLLVAVVGVPGLIPLLRLLLRDGAALDGPLLVKVAGPLFVTLAATIVGMVLTLLLLNDVRHDRVFTAVNVVRLRVITVCGLLMIVPCVVAAGLNSPGRIPFIVLAAVVAAFLGVLMFLIRTVMERSEPGHPTSAS